MTTKYEIVFKNENQENNIEVEGLEHLESRKEDFVWYMENGFNEKDAEIYNEDLPCFYNYGLCLDKVEINTGKCPNCDNTLTDFWDENSEVCEACGAIIPNFYYKYQLSWGGPSEEIRIYQDHVEFVYLNWFCGVSFDITGEGFVKWLIEYFKDTGMINFD